MKTKLFSCLVLALLLGFASCDSDGSPSTKKNNTVHYLTFSLGGYNNIEIEAQNIEQNEEENDTVITSFARGRKSISVI